MFNLNSPRLRGDIFSPFRLGFIVGGVFVLSCVMNADARELLTAGARPLAMGTAYTAVSDDVYSLFYNPAGLTGLVGRELSVAMGRIDVSRENVPTEINVVYGQPWQFKGIPLGAAAGINYQFRDRGVQLFDLSVGAGTDVPTKGRVPWPVRGGASVRIRGQSGSEKEPDVIGSASLGLGVNAGILVPVTSRFSFGFAFMDLFPPNTNPQNMAVRWGTYYHFKNRINFAADLEWRSDNTWIPRLGMEILYYRGLLRLRLGNGYSIAGTKLISLGAGFNFSPYQIDVTYLAPIRSVRDDVGHLRIGLTYRFEAPRFSEIYFDRALGRAEKIDRRVLELQSREEQYQAAVDDLEQARRLAEEELARVRVKEKEATQKANERLLIAERQAQAAEERLRTMEEEIREYQARLNNLKSRIIKRTTPKKKKKPAPKKPKKPAKPKIKTHLVVAGETLRGLAAKYYGSSEKWRLIYDANPDKIDRGRPRIGARLFIP